MSTRFDLVGLDADDTLWHNEPLFQATQAEFRALLARYHDAAWIDERLHAVEMRNLAHFGYGIKGFVLSMIETAVELTDGRVSGREVQAIVDLGRAMTAHPVDLLDGVAEAVQALAVDHRVALVTKGDLLDQEAKLARSGLGEHFAAVEILSEKDEAAYRAVLRRQGVAPERFVMVGNSVRSDVLPVVAIGAQAVHVPYAVTWVHEVAAPHDEAAAVFATLPRLADLPAWLAG